MGRIAADVVRQVWSVVILLGVGLVLGFRVGTNPASALGAVALLVVFAPLALRAFRRRTS
ncbi:MAG TPA: hypothetical protein VFA45_15395 [Actinomycetes bacterium]|nr:hypothetical protein [Actinomycetes bacterium]